MPVVLGSTLFSHQADPPVHFRATGQLRRPTRQTGPASDVSTWNKGTESRLLLRAVNTRLVEVTKTCHNPARMEPRAKAW